MKRIKFALGTSALLLLTACGGNDESSTIAADITSGLPTQYSARAGTSGTATVTTMSCAETGESQAYTCIGTVALDDGSGNLSTDQVQITANWDTTSNSGTWEVTNDVPQS